MKNNTNKKIKVSVMMFTLGIVIFFPLVNLNIGNYIPPLSQDNPGWWNPEWPYRKLITINHTKVSADLTNFPTLISLSSDVELAAAAQPTGQDIVFVWYADNSTVLAHEIEFFNHTTGQLIAWVNITTLSATIDTRIWTYYGNSLCGNQQDVKGTWDSSYVLVQHLQEINGTVYDSTQYGNDGTAYGGLNQSAQGKIDGGYSFDGNDYIEIPDNYSLWMTDGLTVEIWVDPVTQEYSGLVSKVGVSEWDIAGWGMDYQYGGALAFQIGDKEAKSASPYDTPGWKYMVASWSKGGTIDLFVDSIEVSYACHDIKSDNISNTDKAVWIGAYYNVPSHCYHGQRLDEVRISNVARNWSWISTSYENQNSPETFYSVGTEELYQYTLTITIEGQGTVTKEPDQTTYTYGQIVNLTAKPAMGWLFDHWEGDLIGNTNPSTIIIDENKTVIACFIVENIPPIAMNDTSMVLENSTNNLIDVLSNDYDPDGDNLTITLVTQPQHGTSSQDGFFVYYTPDTFYTGPDYLMYNISDGQGGNASATVFITVVPLNIPPYIPSDPIPGDGETNVSITTDLWWTGGDPDPDDTVLYDVYFGITTSPPLVSQNQSKTTFDPGTLAYETTYYWRIVVWDTHNASAEGALWEFTTQKQGEEEIHVTITRPLENSFYFRNIRLFSLPRNTVVYGPITITADVTASLDVDRVEFYIDGKLKKTDDTAPYTYRWMPIRCFKHDIMVKAYDSVGNTAPDELTVFKWRLHPFILLGGIYFLKDLIK